jgi:hydrogenase maturation factor HypF (carbamoyltransferase family)
MVKDLETARGLTELPAAAEALLTSTARPIVLVTAKTDLAGVSPDNSELGLMLPYAPWHFLLFANGAPEVLVMTSANRSSEPIAYQDEEAIRLLSDIADGFFIGQRPSHAEWRTRWLVRGCSGQLSCAGPVGTPPVPSPPYLSSDLCWPSALT